MTQLWGEDTESPTFLELELSLQESDGILKQSTWAFIVLGADHRFGFPLTDEQLILARALLSFLGYNNSLLFGLSASGHLSMGTVL